MCLSVAEGKRPGIRAAFIRWSLVVLGLPFLILPFLGGIYSETIYPLRLRASHTLDILEDDYQELMALDRGLRRRRLSEYAEVAAVSNPPPNPAIRKQPPERPPAAVERLNDATRSVDDAAYGEALASLWDEIYEAARRGDVESLQVVLRLATQIRETPDASRRLKADALRLAETARAQLERVADAGVTQP